MNITKNTIDVLKNMATINQSLLIEPSEGDGTTLYTKSPESTIVGICHVQEKFENIAPIYNLPQFLAVLTSMDNPDVDFGEKGVTISSGKSKSHLYYADKSMIPEVKKNTKIPDPKVSFLFKNDDLQRILKMANVLGLPNIVITASPEKGISLTAIDIKNNTSSNFVINISDSFEGESEYKFYIKTELLKFIPDDYSVDLAEEGIAKYVSSDKSRTYYTALENPRN